MKVLSTNVELSKAFSAAFTKATSVEIAVAWANTELEAVKTLLSHSHKVKRMFVGLTFYGTSPAFLRATYRKPNFKFHLSENGTFHPKLCLFHFGNGSWKAIIGSANFTVGAFEKNHELCLLIGSDDKDAAKTLADIQNTIDQYWDESKRINLDYIKAYEIAHAKRPKTKVLPKKGVIESPLDLSWAEFKRRIDAVRHAEQLKFLRWVKLNWGEQPFNDLDKETRQIIAGFNEHAIAVNHRCFGTTDSRWTFIGVINNKAKAVATALSHIPKNGIIQKRDYERFLNVLVPLFTQNEVAGVSRLLSLYRPDFFIPYNGKNNKNILRELNFPVSQKMDYTLYWDYVITTIQSAQFNHPTEKLNKADAELFSFRAALLDCLYYEPNH
jgi:HKD family nuclease